MAEHESNLAVLVDFENMARPGAKGRGDFDIHLVLNRLADKGRVLVKRAYADWSRYRDARHELQNAGLGLIEMPSAREGAKNRADIQMAVDAMELAYSRVHVDTFVIVSGDSDFTPLIGKLRELNKRVTGVGNRESTSELLIANCDEFIFYDLLAARGREARTGPGGKAEPIDLLRGTLTALQREGVEWPLASVVKDSMRRKYPAFDESDHGFSTFSKFLEDAAKQDIVRLETDPRSGTYRVELTDGRDEVPALPPTFEDRAAEPGDPGRRRRRRARRGEGSASEAEAAVEVESGEEALAPAAETFEFVVSAKAIEPAALPPLDEPISYEDMIMLGPEVGDDLPEELAEVTDFSESGPPARSARRRRRRGATAEPEPTVADLATLGAEDDEDDEAPAAEAEAEVDAFEPVTAEEIEAMAGETADAGEAEEPTEASSRRRRRRRSPAAEPAEGAVESAEAAAEAAGDEVAPAEASGDDLTEAVAVPPVEEAAAEPAEEAAPEAFAPRTRGRVPRGSVRLADGEPDAGEAVAAAEEAPAPKRRTRRKAEPAADEAGTAEVTAVAEEAGDVATAPKRRTRKKAEPVADEAVVAEAGDVATAPKRRTRKKAEPVADEAGSGDVATAAPKRRTRKKAEPVAEE